MYDVITCMMSSVNAIEAEWLKNYSIFGNNAKSLCH